MDLSVIVVTYNQENSIGRTLDSILAQKAGMEFEIVIGDDCSTDGTETVCRDYARKYPGKIRYLRREKNIGLVRNYFDCIAQARGRYLADCAGDDYWCDPLKLQHQFELLEKRPEVSLVATQWVCRNEKTGELKAPTDALPSGEYEGRDIMLPFITNKGVIHLCSALYRKKIIEEAVNRNPLDFVNPDFSAEDIQIVLESGANGKVVILPEVTLHYTVGIDSVSHRKSFAGKFTYSVRSYRQKKAMISRYFPDPTPGEKKILDDLDRKKLDYLTSVRFRVGPDESIEELPELKKFKSKDYKTRIYRFLMKHPYIWRKVLALRNALS